MNIRKGVKHATFDFFRSQPPHWSCPALTVATPAEAKRVYKEWRGKDGRLYCRRTDGTTGLIVGGVRGRLGRSHDRHAW